MAFLKIGKETDFGGREIVRRSILGRHVGIFRTAGGELAAMEVTCRHQNADLTLGRRDGDVIVCPRHGWRYDLTTGACLNEPWARLRRYEVRVENGDVYLATLPGGPFLEQEVR